MTRLLLSARAMAFAIYSFCKVLFCSNCQLCSNKYFHIFRLNITKILKNIFLSYLLRLSKTLCWCQLRLLKRIKKHSRVEVDAYCFEVLARYDN